MLNTSDGRYKDDGPVFGALRPVHGGREGKDQAVEFAALAGDLATVEIDRDLSGFGIDFVSPMLGLRDRRHRPGLPSLAAIEIKDFGQDFRRALAFNLGGASILLGRR